MGKNTSISLGKHFEEFIDKGVQSGRYQSASEVVRAGLRLLEDQESKIIELRKNFVSGEESGFIKDFDFKKHKKELKKSLK